MDQVVEKVINDLASSATTPSFQPTEEQETLGIPTYVIFLAGLVIWKSSPFSVSSNSGFSSLQEQTFEAFQKQYRDRATMENTPVFHSSRRLMPTVEQQASIQRDISLKVKDLEDMSKKAAQELFLTIKDIEDTNSVKTKKKKKKPKNKHSKKQPTIHEIRPTTTLMSQQETHNETLEQVVRTILPTESSSNATIEEDSSSSWVTVGGAKLQTRVPQTSLNERENASIPRFEKIQSSSIVQERGIKPTVSETLVKNLSIQSTLQEQQVESVDHTTNAERNELQSDISEDLQTREFQKAIIERVEMYSSPIIGEMEERIRQLEGLVNEKGLQVIQQEEDFAKQLSREHQDFDNQIQALQLRLYISENKLKTFQDALEHHVQAVSIIHNPLSPNKEQQWQDNASSKKKDPQLSPLFSRVLNRQNLLPVETENTKSSSNHNTEDSSHWNF